MSSNLTAPTILFSQEFLKSAPPLDDLEHRLFFVALLGWDAVENPVHVHDLHATILHLLGLDHERLTYRYAGRDFRLTDVSGNVVHPILA